MKILSIVFLLIYAMSGFAQKKYLTIHFDSSNYAYLSGEIPSSMKSIYNGFDDYNSGSYYYWMGKLLNQLAKEGFEIEQMSTSTNTELYFLLSTSSGTTTQTKSIEIEKSNADYEVTEIARYNLQGMPIDENEKGIQIIVYSNYTTKTIIKQ